MVDAVIETARRAGLAPIVVVAPTFVSLPEDVTRATNDEPSAGLSRSLRLGLAAVPADTAAIVLLGDQPTLAPAHLARLLGSRGSASIVATEADGVPAPPVLLEPEAFALAQAVRGDRGLRDVLRDHREDITFVAMHRHPLDVDTRADLDAMAEECPGCGARFPAGESSEAHEYIGASPACWAAFGELLAREFQDASYGWIHRHTVDIYTVQHPGTDGRRQRQSVALHLIGLCHWLEHGLAIAQLNLVTQRLAAERHDWPWLPPPFAYEHSVLDALAATSGEEHVRSVRSWGASTWSAWQSHHEVIRRWAEDALG